ncbi:hypothetical protein CTZ27_37040 [Streptomyces griseocarneus]|nr:hypothetical protein CTZ27_37040 [Streptomyces griseocarneus]
MNDKEAVALARYVRALCPQQRFDEFTADAWYDVLAPYSLNEARAAVVRHINAGHAFVAVGEIVTEIRKARNDRLDRHTEAEPPPGDTGDHTYQAALLAERHAIASGELEPRPVPPPRALTAGTAPAPGRGRAILAAVGGIPEQRDSANPRAHYCPRCHAQPGHSCTTVGRRRADVHPTRLDAARRAADGLAPADPAEEHAELERRLAASRAVLAALPPDTVIEPDDHFHRPDHQEPAAP